MQDMCHSFFLFVCLFVGFFSFSGNPPYVGFQGKQRETVPVVAVPPFEDKIKPERFVCGGGGTAMRLGASWILGGSGDTFLAGAIGRELELE